MKSPFDRSVTIAALSLVAGLLTGLVAAKLPEELALPLAAGVCVLIVCSLDELFFPRARGNGLFKVLGGGLLRGAVIGPFCCWMVMLYFAVFSDYVGDKFIPFGIVFMTPASIVFGAVVGGVVRLVACQLRTRHA